MTDKNGKQIRTGDIVRISNAYFKNDNGLYYVENSPGDPSWLGKDHCLKKICKSGKISTAKYNICFWPICCFVSDRSKSAEANRWNKEHAEIEIMPPCKDMTELCNMFQAFADGIEKTIFRAKYDFGEDHPRVKQLEAQKKHYESVAEYIRAGSTK